MVPMEVSQKEWGGCDAAITEENPAVCHQEQVPPQAPLCTEGKVWRAEGFQNVVPMEASQKEWGGCDAASAASSSEENPAVTA